MGEEKKKVPLENEDIKEVKEGEEKQKEKSKEIPPVIKKDEENTNVETEKQKDIKNKIGLTSN